MFRTFDIPLSWTELARNTARETMADNVAGLAAQLAYYFFLALFPALLVLVALLSFVPYQLIDQMLTSVAAFAPREIVEIVRQQLDQIARGDSTGLLTAGVLGALWSSSAAVVAIIDALNRAYDIEEGRPWWKVRLTAIALTLGLALFIVTSFLLVLLGPTLAGWLAERFGLGAAFEWTWRILQWPVALLLVTFAIGCINYFAPDAEQDWEWVTPGAVLATVLWLVASLGFKLYVGNFTNYNETYGAIGGVIVLMLWFYISGFAILVGAEMNAEIEHASPHGKDPGEKVAGQKKKLGAAASRAFEERKKALDKRLASDRPAAPVDEPGPVAGGLRRLWPGLVVLAGSLFYRQKRAKQQ